MEIKEKFDKYKGKVSIFNHTTKKTTTYDNIVCVGFYEMLADYMGGTTQSKLSHLGIGNSSTAAAYADTDLVSQVGSRYAFSVTFANGTDIEIRTEISGSEAIFTWYELGLFNAATSGTMSNRTVIDYTHVSGDIITVTWNINKL